MDFTELKQELADRGFTFLSDTRRGQFINRACARLDNMYRWSYREAFSSSAPAVSIPDLGQVQTVTNLTQNAYPLQEASREDLIQWFGSLSIEGTPLYWYRFFSTNEKIWVYPGYNSTDIIGVNYWKAPPTLTGTDTPLAPDRYHLLYVDMAVQMAYRDSDNHAAAESLQVEINRQIFEMVEDLLPQRGPTAQHLQYYGSDW